MQQAFCMVLDVQSLFYESEHHGIEQSRTYIKEVAVQHTGSQQGYHGYKSKQLFGRIVLEEQLNGLHAVVAVGAEADDTAGSQHLNEGVVPPRWEEAYKALGCGPGIQVIRKGIEGAAENGMLQELSKTLAVAIHADIRRIPAPMDKVTEQQQQFIVEQQEDRQRHKGAADVNNRIGPGMTAVKKRDGIRCQIGYDSPYHRSAGAGEQHAA